MLRRRGVNWYDYGATQYDAAIGRYAMMKGISEHHLMLTVEMNWAVVLTRTETTGVYRRITICEMDKIEYKLTVRAVLVNNSSNQKIDMQKLALLKK